MHYNTVQINMLKSQYIIEPIANSVFVNVLDIQCIFLKPLGEATFLCDMYILPQYTIITIGHAGKPI